ncbi:5-carboxymethyl-2-hydroxymuconate Delta-isomerase [Geomicrobium sp. JCM 19039]|uniref:5-carboxymethyl-2-hydroxymuconate Delta-isomerase n=1 Tax=Geomicrobium sp. JCM 19039 TaxID=1460636 RepID=UPI00045F21BA|nr:5-carboxymethyl-2-hydroxymuconate Delta-isomerase [Geomicrobium sp. JCM 19039]GAK12405.1 5-carboxymethyl-2-hydroxymuconate delta-isomerase [Geomicrobium sp. JCM 19039]
MPHIIVEYTANLQGETDVRKLLARMNRVFIARPETFPVGGIRSRAIALTDYVVADDTVDDAFVHTQIRIGAGRSEEEKKDVCDALFHVMEDHFKELFSERYLALSLELYEFPVSGTYKKNNIHERYNRV